MRKVQMTTVRFCEEFQHAPHKMLQEFAPMLDEVGQPVLVETCWMELVGGEIVEVEVTG